MGYEGYEQCICQNGHYFSRDAYNDGRCCACGAEPAWFNCVDQTNGPGEGAIPYEKLQEKFLLTPAKVNVCAHCGLSKIIEPDIFRIPTREETDVLRTFPPSSRNIDEDDYIGGWPMS